MEYNKKFKSQIKNVDDIMNVLAEIEFREHRHLDMIFQGKVKDLNTLQNSILDLKHFFKVNCRVVVSELHADDNEELLTCIVKELEKHHSFWMSAIDQINKEASNSIAQYDIRQIYQRKGFKEYLEKTEDLNPRPNPDILSNLKTEQMLIDQQQPKDARYMRRVILEQETKLREKQFVQREMSIRRKKDKYKQTQERDRQILIFQIQDTLCNAIKKRRMEFERLMVRFQKVRNLINNLQHKEKCRLEYLEKNVVDVKNRTIKTQKTRNRSTMAQSGTGAASARSRSNGPQKNKINYDGRRKRDEQRDLSLGLSLRKTSTYNLGQTTFDRLEKDKNYYRVKSPSLQVRNVDRKNLEIHQKAGVGVQGKENKLPPKTYQGSLGSRRGSNAQNNQRKPIAEPKKSGNIFAMLSAS